MPNRFPLLLGNALAGFDTTLQPVLFELELRADTEDLRAVTLTFELDLVPVSAGGKVRLRPVPIEDSWPAPAIAEILVQAAKDRPVEEIGCLAPRADGLRACPVPGSKPPLVAWSFPVPGEWLMPVSPYVLLVHRDDLAARVDDCLAAHAEAFASVP